MSLFFVSQSTAFNTQVLAELSEPRSTLERFSEWLRGTHEVQKRHCEVKLTEEVLGPDPRGDVNFGLYCHFIILCYTIKSNIFFPNIFTLR
jgi:hypothetical protein